MWSVAPFCQAVVLYAGNKLGNEKRFHSELIPFAEAIYASYLEEIQ